MEPGRIGRPALLLDRDGVVNHDHGYVAGVDRFDFTDGIFALTRRAVDLGYRVAVVTNQSGIARGYYGEPEFRALTAWMAGEFERRGVTLAGVFHCPYLPGAAVPGWDRDSFWRKPGPGMILEAARALELDLSRSILLGDQPSDMAAAAAAGVGRRVLLRPAASAAPDGGATLVVAGLDELTRRLT